MTNEQRRQHQRLLRYQAIISNTLDEVGQRLEALAINIPNDIDSMKLHDKQVKALWSIDAIESEWILDPLVREKMSVIQWGDSKE